MYVPLLARCVRAAKNKAAGHLLYRIRFWMPKATVEHRGRKFVANSAEQWCAQTGLSYDQHRRAIALLRKRGIVETEQHLFGRKNITHVRITALGLEAIETASLEISKNALLAASKCTPLGSGGSAQLHIHGGSYLEVLNGASTATFADAHVGVGAGKDKKKKKVSGKIKIKKKKQLPKEEEIYTPNFAASAELYDEEPSAVSEIRAVGARPDGVRADNESSAYECATNVVDRKSVAEHWKKLVRELHGSYEPPTTSKELNLFILVIKACPPEMVVTVLETCIRNWDDFTRHAKERSGAFSIPSEPRIIFLHKYVRDAVTFTIEYLTRKEVNQREAYNRAVLEAEKRSQRATILEAPACRPEKETERPATREEARAILFGKDEFD